MAENYILTVKTDSKLVIPLNISVYLSECGIGQMATKWDDQYSNCQDCPLGTFLVQKLKLTLQIFTILMEICVVTHVPIQRSAREALQSFQEMVIMYILATNLQPLLSAHLNFVKKTANAEKTEKDLCVELVLKIMLNGEENALVSFPPKIP
jgi:hypothetical protein